MSRIGGALILIILCINASAIIVADGGMADSWDVEIDTGVSDRIDSMLDNFRDDDGNFTEWNPFKSGLSAVAAFITAGIDGIFVVLQVLLAGPLLLANLGFPGWLTAPLYALTAFVYADTIIYVMVGRSPLQ